MIIKVTKNIELSNVDILDIVVTALEGGIGYWSVLCNDTDAWISYYATYPTKTTSEIAVTMLHDGVPVWFEDAESNARWCLTMNKLKKGIALYEIHGHDIKHELDDGGFDADSADAIIQYALFGDVIYG